MNTDLDAWAREAIRFVQAQAFGPAVDRSLRVTLNFHPDHVVGSTTVLRALAETGLYRSQFETGVSNGALAAGVGQQRWSWEQRMFGGAYDTAPVYTRPKYGALNHRRRCVGGAIRFGPAYLRLAEHVLDRTTFCFPDSVFDPTSFGVAGRCDLQRLADEFDAVPRTDFDEGTVGGVLDDYIEAHIHGPVDIARDVEALVLDPCFAGTDVETVAGQLGVPVQWHEGRVLTVAELKKHPDFRGPEAITAGQAVAVDRVLDARILGAALKSRLADPISLKKAWHCVARFGTPRIAATTPTLTNRRGGSRQPR